MEVLNMDCKKFLAGAFALAMCFGVVSTLPVENISSGVVASAEDSVEATSSIYFDFNCDDETGATVAGYKDNGPADVVIPSTYTYVDEDNGNAETLYTVTTIGTYAFENNNYISSVVMPDTVILMNGADTFNGCKNLKSVTLSNNLRNISSRAFASCTALASINIPNSVTEIGESAFNGCTAFESIVIPDSIVSIGGEAFAGCNSLKEVTLSNNLTEIPQSIFSNCTSLESVNIPDSVNTIYNYAFSGCKALKSLTIPSGVSYISKDAFEESGLKDIYYQGTEEEWNNIDGFEDFEDITVHYNATGDEEPTATLKGDLNGDGTVDVLDLLKLKKYLLGIIDTLD